MIVLGIETSCDETAAAVLDGGRKVLSSVVASQDEVHAPYGGVVPELASRDHVRRLLPLAAKVLAGAARRVEDIDLIAYTQGPGLGGALLVGASIATGIGLALARPVVGIHHLEVGGRARPIRQIGQLKRFFTQERRFPGGFQGIVGPSQRLEGGAHV